MIKKWKKTAHPVIISDIKLDEMKAEIETLKDKITTITVEKARIRTEKNKLSQELEAREKAFD